MSRSAATALAALLLTLTVATACGDSEEGSALMRPGQDCLGCHGFSAAGTVYSDAAGQQALAGATVAITDAGGATVTLTTNSAGNFFTSRALVAPLSVTVTAAGASRAMSGANGHCNGCHTAPQRIHVP